MMDHFLNFLDETNEFVGRWISFLIILMILIIVYEASLRYFFNAPTAWVHDVSGWLQVTYIFFGGGFALKRGYFVRVDIIFNRFSPKMKAIVDVFLSTFLFGLFMYVLIAKGTVFAYRSVLINEISSNGQWGGPVWPSKIVVPLGALLLCLCWLSKTIRDVLVLLQKSDKS